MVDPAGNQLPYIDKVIMTVAENLEVLNLRAIAGEYDFQARHIDISKLPVFLENQKKGNYKVYLDPADSGCDACMFLNQTYEADAEIGKWLQNRDFHCYPPGIDRDQLNEAFGLRWHPGFAGAIGIIPVQPGARIPHDALDVRPARRTSSSTALDSPKKMRRATACARQRTLRIEIMTVGGQFLQFTQIAEMIREQWRKIGIQADVSEIERSLAIKRAGANENQAHLWQNDGTEHFFTPDASVPLRSRGWVARTSGRCGRSGSAPMALGAKSLPPMQKLIELWKKAFGVPEEERIKLGKEIWRIMWRNSGPAALWGSLQRRKVCIVSSNMGNVPARMYNSPDGMTPATSRPETFFFKK